MSSSCVVALCSFCEAHGPAVSVCTELAQGAPPPAVLHVGAGAGLVPAPASCCAIAAPLATRFGDSLCAVSAKSPALSGAYAALRNACVRSLSCEVADGVVLFGDEAGGFALSVLFRLADARARGFQRLHSLLLLAPTRELVVASWRDVVRHFRAIIEHLRARAQKVMAAERARGARQDVFLRKLSGVSARSLPETTGDEHIYIRLHQAFARVLIGTATRVVELLRKEDFMMPALTRDGRPARPAEGARRKIDWLDLHARLGEELFVAVYHLSHGNQVVVRGDDEDVVRGIILILQEIVPHDDVVEFSQEYVEPWNALLVGLSNKVAQIDDAPYVLDASHSAIRVSASRAETGESTFVRQVRKLFEGNLGDAEIRLKLEALRQEWMSKAHMFYAFKLQPEFAADLAKFLEVVEAAAEDEAMLRFWTRGLGTTERRRIILAEQRTKS